MKISIGSDHGGYELKTALASYLASLGHEVQDVGCNSKDSVHYPEYAIAAAEAVASGKANFGIVVCTTGIGVSIAANKVKGIRAALCRTENDAKMCREHNDANVLALGASATGEDQARQLVSIFLSTGFAGERHGVRVAMISDYEAGQRYRD